jgi:hypothetical protein
MTFVSVRQRSMRLVTVRRKTTRSCAPRSIRQERVDCESSVDNGHDVQAVGDVLRGEREEASGFVIEFLGAGQRQRSPGTRGPWETRWHCRGEGQVCAVLVGQCESKLAHIAASLVRVEHGENPVRLLWGIS